MINLPAVCDRCETIFPSGFAGGGGATVTIIGSKSGPCPNCGSMGSIPDGTYRLMENIIKVLSAPQRSLEELNRFSELLEKAHKEEISTEELEKDTKREIPGLSSLLDWVVPKTRAEKFQYGSGIALVMLTAAIQLFTSAITNNQPIEQIGPEAIIKQTYEIQNYNVYNNESIKIDKVGRNEPCPCGSGLKYKKCHGK